MKRSQQVGISNDQSFPPVAERPAFVVFNDWQKDENGMHRPGVYFCSVKKGDKSLEPFNQWIASPLHIEAVTFDGLAKNFGRMLRFKPTVGAWRDWAMPMELRPLSR